MTRLWNGSSPTRLVEMEVEEDNNSKRSIAPYNAEEGDEEPGLRGDGAIQNTHSS